ncbi:MAG: YlbF family regulator [Lachnospiraceae bacterium]|nr:YlbF family regulator [Lachnospiraceae bacterium]
MRDNIRQDIRIILNDIKCSPEYREYLRTRSIVKADEKLKLRAEEARRELLRLAELNPAESDPYMGQMELAERMPEVLEYGPIRDYLRADADFCRLIREITDFLIDGLEFEA